LATCGGIAAVDESITPAPWEYPPSTMRVFGQFAAMDWMWVLALVAAAGAPHHDTDAGLLGGLF
jgi:hypothetical protein